MKSCSVCKKDRDKTLFLDKYGKEVKSCKICRTKYKKNYAYTKL